jgi:hypothetical protein
LFPWFVPMGVFCSPGLFPVVVFVHLAVGAMEFGYLCFCCCFPFVLTDSFRLKSSLGVTSVRVLPAFFSLRSMVLRRRSFDTTTQTLFAVSLCSCCLIHRRRRTSTLGAWSTRVEVWLAREGHDPLSGQRDGVFRKEC